MRNKELLKLLRNEISGKGLDEFVNDLIKFIRRICIEHHPYTPVLHQSLFNSYEYFIYTEALKIVGINDVYQVCEQINKDRVFLSKLKTLIRGELYKFFKSVRNEQRIEL